MIQLTNVTKRYGDKTALQTINCSIGKGEIVGLLGRNGAGKSTLMNLLTGYLPPSEGSICIQGIDMDKEPRKAKAFVGYLPEQPPLYESMTVEEYLRFVGKIKGIAPKEIRNEVEEISKKVGLQKVSHRLLGNLSKGYRQRAGIAQAMLGNPDLLVLDEPTAGLDPKQIVEIRTLIRNFGKDRTVLISSHILSEIAEICQRVLVIREGQLVADYSMEELHNLQNGKNHLFITVTSHRKEFAPLLERQAASIKYQFIGHKQAGTSDWEVWSEGEQDIRETIFDAVVTGGCKLLQMQNAETGIEEMFLHITAEQKQTPTREEERV